MIMDLVEIEPVQMSFDYSEYSDEASTSLQRHAANIREIVVRASDEVGCELYEAKQEIHREKKDGWAKWVESEVGFSVQHADRLIRQYKEKYIEHDVQNAIEQPVEPVEKVQECVTLRSPREVVTEWFENYPNLHHLSNREIAKRCDVTEGTVRNYKKELYPPEPVPTPEPKSELIVDVVEITEPEIIDEPEIEQPQPEPEPAPLPKVEPSEEVKQEREIRRQQVQERNEQLREKGVELPTETYACLVVDPPWTMQKIEREERPNQFGFDYPTMTEEELKSFQLPNTGDNCHLYLWTTQKHLPSALRLAEHWGFKYQCLMTWVKNVGFTPFSWMYSTEHVLFCTKGSLPLLAIGKRLDFGGKVREHSRKPDEFYEIVRAVSPEPRIDVFSREKRDGFDQYGNEVEKYV